MKLTVKNIAKILSQEYAFCPFCGGEAEIYGYQDKEGTQIKISCDGCGAQADLLDTLIEIEKKPEDTSWWKNLFNRKPRKPKANFNVLMP